MSLLLSRLKHLFNREAHVRAVMPLDICESNLFCLRGNEQERGVHDVKFVE